jgi:hypothetical protein
MAGQQLVGAGGTSLGALTSIGSDLSVSVSFQVASELLDAAHETDMREDELVGMVLGVAIALSALKKLLEYSRVERRKSAIEAVERIAVARFGAAQTRKSAPKTTDLTKSDDERLKACVDLAKERAEQRLMSEKSLLDFALLFASIATRIAFAVTVQLLAASARARQASRAARILSLMGLAVFFVFVESSAERRIF